MRNKPVLLLNDFNMEFSNVFLHDIALIKNALIETNKRMTPDFNRFSLELRSDVRVISCFNARHPYEGRVEYYDYATEEPIIQVEEGSSKEIFSIKKK